MVKTLAQVKTSFKESSLFNKRSALNNQSFLVEGPSNASIASNGKGNKNASGASRELPIVKRNNNKTPHVEGPSNPRIVPNSNHTSRASREPPTAAVKHRQQNVAHDKRGSQSTEEEEVSPKKSSRDRTEQKVHEYANLLYQFSAKWNVSASALFGNVGSSDLTAAGVGYTIGFIKKRKQVHNIKFIPPNTEGNYAPSIEVCRNIAMSEAIEPKEKDPSENQGAAAGKSQAQKRKKADSGGLNAGGDGPRKAKGRKEGPLDEVEVAGLSRNASSHRKGKTGPLDEVEGAELSSSASSPRKGKTGSLDKGEDAGLSSSASSHRKGKTGSLDKGEDAGLSSSASSPRKGKTGSLDKGEDAGLSSPSNSGSLSSGQKGALVLERDHDSSVREARRALLEDAVIIVDRDDLGKTPNATAGVRGKEGESRKKVNVSLGSSEPVAILGLSTKNKLSKSKKKAELDRKNPPAGSIYRKKISPVKSSEFAL